MARFLAIKDCERCGAAFSRPRDYSQAQWESRRFCGRNCGNKAPSKYSDPRARIEEHVHPEPNSGCWIWTGTESRYGYGQLRLNGTWTLAHRKSFELHKGEIPAGLSVLHHCDNRLCVNPDHLYAGTAMNNVQDMLKRGRGRWQKSL